MARRDGVAFRLEGARDVGPRATIAEEAPVTGIEERGVGQMNAA